MTHKSPTQPLCHYCGKPIAKDTETHYASEQTRGRLHSKADCQSQTNHQVVSLTYHQPTDYYSGEKTGERYVRRFSTWDGESYKDEFFCSGTCSTRFAYFMARAGHCTNLYNQAKTRQNAKPLTKEQRKEAAQ